MRRWLAALVIVLSLLLTGCENNNGYYAVVYPYTVTVEGQEFTFLGPKGLGLRSMKDANGHEYHFRKYESDRYRVIEIHYDGNVKYIWKQDMEHEEISFGDYSESFDLTGYTPGEILVQAIQMPAPEMEYVPPQKTPLSEKKFPWAGLLLAIYGVLRLAIPGFKLLPYHTIFGHTHWHCRMDSDPDEDSIRWAHIEGVVWLGVALLLFLSYLFS